MGLEPGKAQELLKRALPRATPSAEKCSGSIIKKTGKRFWKRNLAESF